MKNQDPSLSTEQRIEAFQRKLGTIIRVLLGLSTDELPSGLPRSVKPDADPSKKGAANDKSKPARP